MLMLKPFLMHWHCPRLRFVVNAVWCSENTGLHTGISEKGITLFSWQAGYTHIPICVLASV